ncbi:MAG: hypothetical protein QW728_05965 [Thermoplasmata archaeon]
MTLDLPKLFDEIINCIRHLQPDDFSSRDILVLKLHAAMEKAGFVLNADNEKKIRDVVGILNTKDTLSGANSSGRPDIIAFKEGKIVLLRIRINGNINSGTVDVEKFREYKRAGAGDIAVLINANPRGESFTAGLSESFLGVWKNNYLHEIVITTGKQKLKIAAISFDGKGRQVRTNY